MFYTFYKDFLGLGYKVSVSVCVSGTSCVDMIDENSMAELCSHFMHCTVEAVRKLQPVLSPFTFNGLYGDELEMELLLHSSVLQLRDGCSW